MTVTELNNQILHVVGLASIIIALIGTLVSSIIGLCMDHLKLGLLALIITIVAGSVVIGNLITPYIEQRNEILKTYTYYIDGRKVDPDLIDLNQYHITIDDENRRVLITN